MIGSTQPTSPWERYAWAAGIVFVVALLAESVISVGVGLTHHDSAATVAAGLDHHAGRLVAIRQRRRDHRDAGREGRLLLGSS